MNIEESADGGELQRQTGDLTRFASSVFPKFELTPFHTAYYAILEKFARREIKRLIISVPPQHGKSLGSSVLLPAYMLGLDPDLKIAIASYNATLASRFNKRVQRLIDSERYAEIYPATRIKGTSARSSYVRTASQVEVIDRAGELFSVGREGSLTGNEVDVIILDDLYKDAMEANSPLIRENCWEWYTSVVRTRLHNDSSEMIVFTRWHEDDLIGRILAKEKSIALTKWSQLDGLDTKRWVVVNFEALKESAASIIDPRAPGEALWPARHDRELLLEKRSLDPFRFGCMYQGRPSAAGGYLYGDSFRTYRTLPAEVKKRSNYTDTADTGDDYLCSVCYEAGMDGAIYIRDVTYSREPMEVTEQSVAAMLARCGSSSAVVESNNGGRGFARAVARLAPRVRIGWFHQSGNKEARILSNSSTVLHNILMPVDWAAKWPEFHNHLVTYRRDYKTNRWHDAPDVLSGIVEKEVVEAAGKRIKRCVYADNR